MRLIFKLVLVADLIALLIVCIFFAQSYFDIVALTPVTNFISQILDDVVNPLTKVINSLIAY